MTFQQLLYFQSVADSLSFSKAAKECFVSQTAISRQIRQLEQEMDLRLFDRDTTHVTLTSAGRYFFQQAQQITAQLRQAVETAQQIDRASACQLVLAAPTVFEQWAAAPLLHGLRQRHPEASLSVVQGARTSLINDLVEANLDILLALDFDMPSLDGLRVDVLSTHHAVWLLPAGHPLAGQAAIAPQQLRGESFIMTRESPTAPTIDRIGAYLHRLGLENVAHLQADSLSSAFLMVQAGLGVMIVPSGMEDLFPYGLRCVPIDGLAWEMNLLLLTSPQRRIPFLQELLDSAARTS
jgi:DNA-binding transcriptional LysR family regulator